MAVRRALPLALWAAVIVVLAGCGDSDDELTTGQLLQKVTGQTMTSAQIDDRLATADMLCGFDTAVLVEIWDQLDTDQLEFQDYVFGRHCADRLSVYESARPDLGTVPAELTRPTMSADDAADLLESVSVADDQAEDKAGDKAEADRSDGSAPTTTSVTSTTTRPSTTR